jgi:hypothetical protein
VRGGLSGWKESDLSTVVSVPRFQNVLRNQDPAGSQAMNRDRYFQFQGNSRSEQFAIFSPRVSVERRWSLEDEGDFERAKKAEAIRGKR